MGEIGRQYPRAGDPAHIMLMTDPTGYVPKCAMCEYVGKRRTRHGDARQAVTRHQDSKRHKFRLHRQRGQ